MAKIDVTKIEGYEAMSAEEKLAALESFELPDPDYSGWVKKDIFDKTASDLATIKKERNGAEKEKKDIETRLIELERKDKISTIKDKYMASGFSAELAMATAEAFVDGNMDVVLENNLKHATDVATAERDKVLKETPVSPASGNPNPVKVDYDAERDKALAAGDFTSAARYERLKIEQK